MQNIWVLASMAMWTIAVYADPRAVGNLSACAVRCIADTTSLSPDTLFTSICTSKLLSDRLEQCISSNCTIKESLTTKNMTETSCQQPLRDRTKAVSIPAMVGVLLALLAFILRLFARLTTHQFGPDDWSMVAAMVFVVPLSAMAIDLADRGLGKDIWTIPFYNITYILHIYYFDELLYLSSLATIRVSILYFYLRIFPQKTFQIIIYAIIVGNIFYGTTFVFVGMFQCVPVQAAWIGWDGTTRARCVNVNALGWASGAINIVLDIIVLLLPIPGLIKLMMSWQRKLHLLIIFCMGSFVVIVSILRLTSLIKFGNTQNITWDYVPVGYWSTIEVHASVVCACLPALPSLFRSKSSIAPLPNFDAYNNNIRPLASRGSDFLPLLEVANT